MSCLIKTKWGHDIDLNQYDHIKIKSSLNRKPHERVAGDNRVNVHFVYVESKPINPEQPKLTNWAILKEFEDLEEAVTFANECVERKRARVNFNLG